MVDVLKQATLILAASTLVACASSTKQQSAAEQSATEQAAPVVASADGATETPVVYGNEDRMVCKRYAPTGTRVSKKVCAKQSQWDAITKSSQDLHNDTSRRALHANSVNPQ